MCWNCGRSGHVSKDCQQKKSDDRGATLGPCWKCGQKGHAKKDCKVRGFVDSEAEPNEEDNLDDPGSLMTLSHQFVTSSSVNSVSSGETVYRSSECTDPAGRWLVDSGATSHIIGRQHLQCYTVVHEYEDVRCELRAANNSLIETYGVVDVRVRFKGDNGRAKQRVLSRCIVADIPFNVMSPYVLVHNGWECVLSDGRRSFLRFSVPGGTGVEIPLHVKESAWWAQAVVEGPEKPSKKGKGHGC